MAKISVIVPVYNCEAYITQCIESVLRQTFRDFELILVDDGSKDKSPEICERYALRDSRIKVIHKPNGGGAGEARNVGLDSASSPFISFIDSDDWIKADMLEKLWAAQQRDDSDLVICGYRNIVSSVNEVYNFNTQYEAASICGNHEVKDFFIKYFPEGMVGYPWNKLYRLEIIRAHHLRFPKMRRLEDGIFNTEFFSYAEKITVLSDVLYNYRASQQVEQRKLPKDFYSLMETFVKHYYHKLRQWGYQIEAVQKPIVYYFLNDFVGCLENIFFSSEYQSGKERMEAVKALRHARLVDYMLKQERTVGRYARIVLALFEKKHYMLMGLVIKVKILLKVRLYKLFQMIKKVAN